ncbi:MAG: o-succinylbenzoate--CoA ligase [Oscillochloridaceae bacterium umkhey_bin13]
MHHLPDWLARRAAIHPARLALLTPTTTWSFAELEARVRAMAARLLAMDLAPGARVALLARNTPAYAVAVHAVPRTGCVLVPLNTRLAPAELAWQLADCGASLFIADAAYAELAATLVPPTQFVTLEPLAALPQPGLTLSEPAGFGLDQPHTIIYTSGTTGRPKGAMLSVGNHWWSASASVLNLGLHADDRWLAVLPLFHVGGLSILLRGAIYGMPVILHDRFDPAQALAAIHNQGVTIVSLVAVMLQRLLDVNGAQPLPSHFRCALLGGGPAPRPLLEQAARLGVPVVQTYGMTETASQAVTLSPADALRKQGSAGQPLLPLDLKIMADDQPALPGQIGEICLRGPMVILGYHGQPAATAAAIRDGWLHTGDLGYLDADGFLFVVERRSDLIISGGENIYPAELEAVLLAHPAVAEAGVIGRADPQWGQVPVAFVVPRPGVTPDPADLLAHCRAQLAAYKIPRQIILVAELPRTAAGKLRRVALRDMSR